MKEKEWEIILIYIWVSSLDICKERIIERVKKGGHPVPYRIIKARYTKSLDNYLNRYLPLCDNSYVLRMTLSQSLFSLKLMVKLASVITQFIGEL